MILADRHHADLLYALQRLFEDRLGVDLMVPVGPEWWTEGYWRFGEVFGDDRLAAQYLYNEDGRWRAIGDGTFFTHDPAHPSRAIFGCSLEWALDHAAEWKFVVPSVQENLAGYSRFAERTGARLLYQVGNTGQQVDWDLDPFVLSTSELEVPEGRGLTMHQEIDSGPGGPYAFSDIERDHPDPKLVTNAVNAFNRLPGYSQFLVAEADLPGWRFRIHGHEGRDGDINPVGALAARMRASGWGWHDKPVGDGFGHVIHAWAAIGRPLVGHARYYRGKQAEPFWQDGVTCLDLDARPLKHTINLMQDIASSPERHAEMGRAIRATFDRLVDYDAEAEAVRVALGL